MGQDETVEGGRTGGPPDWLADALGLEPFDVRPALAAGDDPFLLLMERAATVDFGQLLAVDAPFNPSPLRRVLASQGFSSYGRKLAEGHWRVFFRRDGGTDWERDAEIELLPEGAACWSEEDGLHIDVRKLKPPQPMLAILRVIERMPVGDASLVVHHERMPHFLLPELAERGWRVARVVEETFNVRLWLEREPG
jgi:hypothetical protein